jgi:hypothetical protein
MKEEEQSQKLNFLKRRLREKFVSMAVPMNQLEYNKRNYNKLFPDNMVITPTGEVRLGAHQFEKLKVNKREYLLGAMYQTLTEPIAVINSEDNKGKKAQLYTKSFRDNEAEKIKSVMSVVVNIDDKKVVISTHRKDIKDIINKIKNAADLIYEKPNSGQDG